MSPSLDVVRTGPLALAALAYWQGSHEARLALGVGLRSEAVELIERLRDMAETGHPKIRAHSAGSTPALLTALAVLAEISQ